MTEHTPGPWSVGVVLPEGAIRIECVGPHIGSVRWSLNRSLNEGTANARLIAAAPDLLEALKKINANSVGVIHHSLTTMADNAIAKATKGTQ